MTYLSVNQTASEVEEVKPLYGCSLLKWRKQMPLDNSFDVQFHGTHENGYHRRTNIISTVKPVPNDQKKLLVDHNHDAIWGGKYEREMTPQEVAKLQVPAQGKGWVNADPKRHYYIVEAFRD